VRRLTRLALLTSLTAVITMAVNIPLPHVKGYINIGDSVILLTGLLLGPGAGAVVGGVGSAMADLILGYPHWAGWTLAIKGLEGFLAGRLGKRPCVGALAGVGAMAGGYFVAGCLMYGSVAPALAQLPFDLIQGGISCMAALTVRGVLKSYLQS
jgi:uncharacterized membrane protein